MREVGEEDLGLDALAGQADRVFDLLARHGSLERGQVERPRGAGGTAVPHDAPALARAVAGDEVEYTVGLPGEGAETEVFFSDLSHEYVTINAEYTT